MVYQVESPREPSASSGDCSALLTRYLDFYRDAVLRKIDGLTDAQLRHSAVPSGWTPLGLLKHLGFVELRWMRWGFAAERIEDPWADDAANGGWRLEPEETVADIRSFFLEQCARSREITVRARPEDHAAVGGRFTEDEQPPTLAWILFHLLQEYARHVGHLDIAREFVDGVVGE